MRRNHHTRSSWHLTPFIVAGAGVAAISFVSPWPAALVIRGMFEKDAVVTEREMRAYVPAGRVRAVRDIQYSDAGIRSTLNVYSPVDSAGALPTVVWIHGGAWISGRKEHIDPYVEIIASHGYTTVSLEYPIAPEARYPEAVRQLNDALAYLVTHADELGIDPDRIVLAGDSAGAQLASQLVNLATNPEFATTMRMRPGLRADQVRGVILNCGIYDVSGVPRAKGVSAWGFRIALWAYLGTRHWVQTSAGDQMSSLNYVTPNFPPTWISGGNGDALTDTQSRPFAERLRALGVNVTSLFYDADHEPQLPHEYQFRLNYEQARHALTSTLAFLKTVTA